MSGQHEPVLEMKTRIDEIASMFERQWGTPDCVSVEDLIAEHRDLPCNELLRELILLEIELRQVDGHRVTRSEYRQRFRNQSHLLEAILDEAGVVDESMMTLLSSADATSPSDHTVIGDSWPDRAGGTAEPSTLALEPQTRPEAVQQPRVIGDYEILEPIGEGGMGVVYKAKQRSLNRVVALKLIKSGLTANTEELRRFQTEAEAAAKLNHPNILPVYEFGRHGESTLFIAMPFIQGKTLREKLGSNTMSPHAAATMLLTLAKAIAHAHERKILHRDLKPNNILFDERQNPLIMDFGLACDLSSDEHLTRTSQILGTPQFMPPEQAGQKDGRTDFRSDIYALGAILYYCLRGVAPFTGASGYDVIQRVLNDDPVSPRVDDRSIPRDLETICMKCLRKEKGERYQTAEDLAADLSRFLEGKPIIARPLPAFERVIRWCRRRPWQAALIGLLMAFAVTASATAGVMSKLRQEEHEARLLAEAAKSDALDATLMAHEQQVRAQLSARDPGEMTMGTRSDDTTQPSSAKSVDNAYVEHERAFFLPKVLNSSTGDWGYFDFRPSPDGRQIVVCDQAGSVQVLDASTGREVLRLASAVNHPEQKWDMHFAFFESSLAMVEGLKRPAFTFSVDWVDETTIIAVDDQKRVTRYLLKSSDDVADDQSSDVSRVQNPDEAGSAFVSTLICELPEPGHLVRVRSTDGAILVCLGSGVIRLMTPDNLSLAINSDIMSRPMNCQYVAQLKMWIVGFENGDVAAFDDQLNLITRLSTGSAVHSIAVSRDNDQWVADIAGEHRPIVRYIWNAETRTFDETAVFDIRSRRYGHYFTATRTSADQSRIFARDNKGHIVAWDTRGQELLGMFEVTQPKNQWLSDMKATLRWPAILDRQPAYLDLTKDGRLRAVDAMGVIMEFAIDGPAKPAMWKTLNFTLGGEPSLAAVSRSPNLFWAIDSTGTLSKVDAAAGNVVLSIPNAHPGPSPSLFAMSDGRLVTVSGDRTLRVWTTDDGMPREIRRIEHDHNLISLAVHEKTGRIAAMDEMAVVLLWEIETGGMVSAASLTEAGIPDGKGPRKSMPTVPRPYTGKMAFNLTGQYLAVFGVRQQFEVLDCTSHLEVVKVEGQHDARALGGTMLCWSGTNPWRLLEGDEYGIGPAWIAGKEPATHTSRISGDVAFGGYPADGKPTPDGGRLCLLMRDGNLLFVTSEHFVTTIQVDTGLRDAVSLGIGSTGQTLLVAGRNGALRSAVFADFSLPEESTLRKLKGTRHRLVAKQEMHYPRPSSLFAPVLNSAGAGTLALLVTRNPREQNGELFLLRRRDEVWRLDPVRIPDSPGADGPLVHSESPGIAFSRDDRPVVALRQTLLSGSYNGRVLLARETAPGSWETEVVLDSGNEGHTCFPIRDADGEVNSVLHFDAEALRLRYSRRGPLTERGWPTETLIRGRGFRLNGFQSSDGTVHACVRSVRGNGDFAPSRYLITKPGEPLRWEYPPGTILTSLSDGTPVVTNYETRESTCGDIYRRNADGWTLWTRIPGTFSDLRILSQTFVADNHELWLADYRKSARRLYAWNFRDERWSCYEIDAELPNLITSTCCWIEPGGRLIIVLAGASSSEPGGVDVIETPLPIPVTTQ